MFRTDILKEAKSDRAMPVVSATITLGTALVALALWQVSKEWQPNPMIAWLTLALLTMLVGTHPIRIPGTKGLVSASESIVFLVVILFGVPQAVLISSLDAFIATRRNCKRISSILFSVATMALSIFMAGTAYEHLITGFYGLRLGEVDMTVLTWALMILAALHFMCNSLLVSTVIGLRYRRNIWDLWKNEFSWTLLGYFCSASIAGLVYFLYCQVGFLTAVGILVIVSPVLGIIYFSYKTYAEKSEEKLRHIQEISKVHLSTIECLATAIDAKDQVTHGHIRRVQIYALEMAKLLKLSELEVEGLRAAALLHDIGKIGVPEYILNKPAKLTPSEYEKIKTHAVIGAEILGAVDFPYPVIPGVLHHHERWDGKGYPDGLKGEAIPLAARILSLTDFFDAMTSDRPYRKALAKQNVLRIIQEESGKMFDPHMAQMFCENVDAFERVAHEAFKKQAPSEHRLSARSSTGLKQVALSSGVETAYDKIAAVQNEMLAFYEITRNLRSSLEMSDLLDIIGNKLEKLVPYTDLVIYLCDKGSDMLTAAHASGPHQECFKNLLIPRGQGVSGWALANHRYLASANPALDVDAERLGIIEDLKNVAVFPLYRQQENLGCISLYSDQTGALNEDHVRIMELVTQQFSEALANAILYESTRIKSLTDPLTGLPNSRYLYMHLEQQLERAERDKESFSLIVMDLDGIKKVNDMQGHQHGDEVLKDFADVLRRNIRESDALFRYAGDEFILVLPRSSVLEAQMSVSRLQEIIAHWSMDMESSRQAPIGISAGCSCYPEDGQTMEELLLRADRRMYDDKHRRRQVPQEQPVPQAVSVERVKITV